MQVVESRLGIVVVASVAEGVEVSYAVGAGNGGAGVVGDGQELAPGAVRCAVLPFYLTIPGDIPIIENRKNCPTPQNRSVSIGQSSFSMERRSKCKGGYAITPSPYMERMK